jgi:phosphoserine phosphatase
VELSERGCSQARLVAQRLRTVSLKAVYTSDLARARVTAEAIAAPHGLPVLATCDLREAYLGAWQGRTVSEAAETDADLVALWRSDSLVHRPPDGERLEDVSARAVAAARRIAEKHPGETVAVVGHGGSLKSILCWAIKAPLSSMPAIRMDNGSISVLHLRTDRVELEVCNDTCHLGGEKVTPVF